MSYLTQKDKHNRAVLSQQYVILGRYQRAYHRVSKQCMNWKQGGKRREASKEHLWYDVVRVRESERGYASKVLVYKAIVKEAGKRSETAVC